MPRLPLDDEDIILDQTGQYESGGGMFYCYYCRRRTVHTYSSIKVGKSKQTTYVCLECRRSWSQTK